MEIVWIDPDRAQECLAAFLRAKLVESRKRGIALGLSGGIDSAVTAGLCLKVTGDPSKVFCLHMPDRHTDPRHTKAARMLARTWGMRLREIDITETALRQGAYALTLLRLRPFPSWLGRPVLWGLLRLASCVLKEPAYIFSLRKGSSPVSERGHVQRIVAFFERSFNIRHILRRKMLEECAAEEEMLPVGCANRSEFFVGWFVKDGIDDLPTEPLLALYKTEVLMLARHLGIPLSVLRSRPSPDMLRGLADEVCIGFSYEKIDLVAYMVEHGLEEDVLHKRGLTLKEIEGIKMLHRLSAWKRENLHEFPRIVRTFPRGPRFLDKDMPAY